MENLCKHGIKKERYCEECNDESAFEEELMSEIDEKLSDIAKVKKQLEYAESILRAATHLVKFCEIGAPSVLIEETRRQLYDRLFLFPVDSESQKINREGRINENNRKENFLLENGYYNDLAED